jgi:uncharacterized protein YecE (DUF72 family)
MKQGRIRIGVGGWTYEPWRGVFYPGDLPQRRELEFASRKLTTIEINGTYYGSQKPESFQKWHDETPEDFIFSVKGPRFATNRKVLADGAESVARFMGSGVTRLQKKLGPILWQFMATKKFDAEDFEGFLKLLPDEAEGLQLRHVVEVRHESFRCAEFIDLVRSHGVAVATAVDGPYPQIADPTADFSYLRIMGTTEAHQTGLAPTELDEWVNRLRKLARGEHPSDLAPLLTDKETRPRDVFAYVISGHKVANPAAATALLERLDG